MTEPPRFGDLVCDDCDGPIPVRPIPKHIDPIQFAGRAEIEEGAAEVRRIVEEMKGR